VLFAHAAHRAVKHRIKQLIGRATKPCKVQPNPHSAALEVENAILVPFCVM